MYIHIAVVVGWDPAMYSAEEGDGEVEMCAAILNGTISVGTLVVSAFPLPGVGTAEIGIGECIGV